VEAMLAGVAEPNEVVLGLLLEERMRAD
jgi:hypothetical protein